jgi:lipopolysaccharide export LptBFGC system permease protein LptF
MPETPSPGGQRVIALAMMVSAIALTAVAFLIYTGVIPMGEDTRPIAALVVGVAAFADLLIGIWFFRRGQSS